MKTFIPENIESKHERVDLIIKNLPGKSSGYFDGNSYYYDKENKKYYCVDFDYNIYEISKITYDEV